MPELKPGWRRVKFGEVVRLGKERCDPNTDGIERYIGLEHIEPGDLRVRSWGEVSDGTTFTTRVRPGQVLFGKRRAYQRKVAVADFDAVCSGDIYVFESANPAKLLPELLPFLCQTDAFFEYAVGTSAGSLSPRTNWTSLAEYQLVLPPLEEQRRVADILTCSTLVGDSLRKATATAEGAYTSALMSSFAREDLSRSINPDSWVRPGWLTKPLELVADPTAPISYGIVQPGDSVPDGVPTATSNNLNIGFADSIHLTSPDIEAGYARSRIEPHDVLVTVKGFGTGNIAIVPSFFRGNITRDVARIRFENPEDGVFFVHLWKCSVFERYWRAVSVGTTRPELSIGKLRAMLIPWPDPEHRRALASQLSRLSQTVIHLEERRSHAAALHKNLIFQGLCTSISAAALQERLAQ